MANFYLSSLMTILRAHAETTDVLDLVIFLTLVHHLSIRGGVAQRVARLTRNVEVVGSSPIKGPRCFLEQETLPILLSTSWFQERIRA